MSNKKLSAALHRLYLAALNADFSGPPAGYPLPFEYADGVTALELAALSYDEGDVVFAFEHMGRARRWLGEVRPDGFDEAHLALELQAFADEEAA